MSREARRSSISPVIRGENVRRHIQHIREDIQGSSRAHVIKPQTHTYNFCIRLAVDLGIFHILVERGSRPIGSADLATLCGAQELLIGRFIPVMPYSKVKNFSIWGFNMIYSTGHEGCDRP